jgi:hypothetical protein
MCRCHVMPMVHVGFPPAAPLCARAVHVSHAAPSIPQASWAPRALKQSCHPSYVLACPSEVWESVIILDDSPMHVAVPSAHLITVLCDLMLECHVVAFIN